MAAGSFDQCRFAVCLEKYEAIWNDKSKEHADKSRRKAQMKAMAEELGISPELVDTKYNSLRTYFVKQRRRVQESQRRSHCGEVGSVFRPSWPPYSKLLFLEEALAGIAPIGLSDLEDNEDLSLATMVPQLRRCPDLPPFDDRSSEPELGLITMVKNPRIDESFYATEDSPSSDPPPNQDDGISGRMNSERLIKSNVRNSGTTPEFLNGSRTSGQSGIVHSPITINDESQQIEKRRLQEESGKLPMDSVRSHSSRPQSPIFPPTDLSPHSVSTFTLHDTNLRPNTPNSLSQALSTDTSPQSTKSRKRSLPNTDDDNLGSVFHDTIDSLRTVAESIREDANDDVGGFLKMIGFQLRNINDPLRRMRAMHAIQGVILNEITSTIK
ncbi:uncharacterized protein LOC114539471 [Dendronephthya gigantea]|uniref:uncharacterized protein LOC114539471 n=1 Tax=Dendronephthya gigantea TaxID=151771 RepID=UPI00106AE558|nr:uncharacterized protein LOC114539471 [Dendronephthya gigantea]